MHPVGQKDYDDLAIEVHPDGCSGIAQVADRKRREPLSGGGSGCRGIPPEGPGGPFLSCPETVEPSARKQISLSKPRFREFPDGFRRTKQSGVSGNTSQKSGVFVVNDAGQGGASFFRGFRGRESPVRQRGTRGRGSKSRVGDPQRSPDAFVEQAIERVLSDEFEDPSREDLSEVAVF